MKKITKAYSGKKAEILSDIASETLISISEKTSNDQEFIMVMILMNEMFEEFCKQQQITYDYQRVNL